jgi:hypothetical protein
LRSPSPGQTRKPFSNRFDNLPKPGRFGLFPHAGGEKAKNAPFPRGRRAGAPGVSSRRKNAPAAPETRLRRFRTPRVRVFSGLPARAIRDGIRSVSFRSGELRTLRASSVRAGSARGMSVRASSVRNRRVRGMSVRAGSLRNRRVRAGFGEVRSETGAFGKAVPQRDGSASARPRPGLGTGAPKSAGEKTAVAVRVQAKKNFTTLEVYDIKIEVLCFSL